MELRVRKKDQLQRVFEFYLQPGQDQAGYPRSRQIFLALPAVLSLSQNPVARLSRPVLLFGLRFLRCGLFDQRLGKSGKFFAVILDGVILLRLDGQRYHLRDGCRPVSLFVISL